MNALFQHDWRTKFAADQDVEKTFMDLAYQELQNKALPLMQPQYRLGFEIVDKNEDNTRLVGIFAFKVADSLYYAPVFFLNGQVKGTDLLYCHGTKSFVPMQEKWLQYIINTQKGDQGKGTDVSKVEGWKHGPNFYQLLYPPGRHKVAAVVEALDGLDKQESGKAAWMEMGLVAAMLTENKEAFEKKLLPEFLSKVGSVEMLETLIDWMKKSPKFAQALADVYPENEYLVKDLPKKADEQGKEKIVVVRKLEDKDMYNMPTSSQEDRKKELVKRKYTVIDNRPEKEYVRGFEVGYGKHLFNPIDSGVYNMLTRGGTFLPVVVSCSPMNNFGERETGVLVFPIEGECRPFLADTRAVFVENLESTKEYDPMEHSIAVEDLKPGKNYVLFDPVRWTALCPVTVDGTIQTDGELERFTIRKYYMPCRIPENDGYYPSNAMPSDKAWDSATTASAYGLDDACELEIANKEQIRPLKLGRCLRVPANFRAIEIPSEKDSKLDVNRFLPGGQMDVSEYLMKSGVHRVEGMRRGSDELLFKVDGIYDSTELGPEGAVLRLMAGAGFKEADAREFVDLIRKEGSAELLIKAAIDSKVIQTGNIPDFFSGFDGLLNANTEWPQRLTAPIFTTTAPPPIARVGDKYMGEQSAGTGVNTMDPQSLMQFAQMNQIKSVFDHGVVGQLAKTYSSAAVLDQYMDKLMANLDILGRIIFLFYWKNNEFVSMFGSDEQPEMEAKLLGNFKNFGDLIMDLKTKTLTDQEDQKGKNPGV